MPKVDCPTKCNFWNIDRDTGNPRYVGGKGFEQAKLAIVGEGPGKVELFTLEPFTGEGGAVLNWLLRKSGIIKYHRERLKKLYITNVVKCFPSKTDTMEESVNIPVEVKKCCRQHLIKELKRINPKFILSLGSHSIQTLSNDYKLNISSVQSFFKNWIPEMPNCSVLPTVHPAYILRYWGATSSALHDFKQMKRALDNDAPPAYDFGGIKPQYRTIRTIPELRELVFILEKQKLISVDTETTSLQYWDPYSELIGVSFSWAPGQAAWVPLMGQNRKKIWTDAELKAVLEYIKRVVENVKIKKVGQNIKYDINWFRRYGIIMRNIVHDTMQFQHLYDENTPENLTWLTSYYDLGFPHYEAELEPYKKKMEEAPPEKLGFYACADSDATLRIYLKQIDNATKNQVAIYNKISDPISKYASEIEFNGVLLDVKRVEALEEEYEELIHKSENDICKLVKRDSFNVASPKQVQQLLYSDLNMPILRKTTTGLPAVDEDVLTLLKNHNEVKNSKIKQRIIEKILEIRGYRKMMSTYLVGLRKLVDKNGRIHCNCKTTGTVTGRLATSDPDIQNLPRDPIFRSLFISGPGRKLIIADYSQLEARLLAFLAEEVRMLIEFAKEGFDIHLYNASEVLGKPMPEVTKEERSVAKAVTFGLNYGRSKKSIAEEYALPYDEVEQFYDGYFEVNRKIASWRKERVIIAKRDLKLSNPIGRIRHFDGFEWAYSDEMKAARLTRMDYGFNTSLIDGIIGNMERQAINFPIQSYGHELLVQAIHAIRTAIFNNGCDAFVVIENHDCVIVDCADKDVETVKQFFEKLMPRTLRHVNAKGKEIKIDLPIDLIVESQWKQ